MKLRGCSLDRAIPVGIVFLGLLATACSESAAPAGPIRLVDRFEEATIEGSPPVPEPAPPTEWSFRGGEASGGAWAPGQRTAELRLTGEGLTGRSTGPHPSILLERESPAGVDDQLHEIVIRARVSGGTTMSVVTLGADGPPSVVLAAAPSDLTHETPVIAGEDFHTYRIVLDRSFGLGPTSRSAITRVVLRPTDETGVEFTIESVRLVFRKERFASMSSGIGWYGLADLWRDTVVSRAPETVTWTVELPQAPWLDVALGTVSGGPVGFAVAVAGADGERRALHRETLTTPERWEARRIDLAEWAGRTVELSMTARGEEGALALWGSPVVRSSASLAAADGGEPRATGVIVVLADTLRKHHLGVYGHKRPTTPHLGRVAAEGVLFEDAISQGTWTKVSVPAILSSLYPTTHQIVSFNDRLPSAAVTLAEALQGAGFATWASSSVPFSGQLSNLHQGVEVLYESGSVDDSWDSKTGRLYVDELVSWLESHHDVPFFAFVHAMDPHSPYRPYPPYDTLWTDEAAGRRYERQMDEVREHIRNPVLKRFGMPTRDEMEAAGVPVEPYLEHERAWYDASILALDAEVGRLMEALERLGRDRHTVVAFVSDHGEEFLEHGSHWHGLSVYAEMIEVPLILRWPGGVPAGRVVRSTVQTIDLMPTLLELAGLPIPETAQGRSLAPLWSGGGDAARSTAFSERKAQVEPGGELTDAMVGSDSLAVVQDGWKLIWNTRRAPGVPEHELYRRADDPLDQENLAAEHPEVVEELRELLERWQESAIAARLPSDDEAAEDLSAEELERLRSLGYI